MKKVFLILTMLSSFAHAQIYKQTWKQQYDTATGMSTFTAVVNFRVGTSTNNADIGVVIFGTGSITAREISAQFLNSPSIQIGGGLPGDVYQTFTTSPAWGWFQSGDPNALTRSSATATYLNRNHYEDFDFHFYSIDNLANLNGLSVAGFMRNSSATANYVQYPQFNQYKLDVLIATNTLAGNIAGKLDSSSATANYVQFPQYNNFVNAVSLSTGTLEANATDYIRKDGTMSLTSDWNAGQHKILLDSTDGYGDYIIDQSLFRINTTGYSPSLSRQTYITGDRLNFGALGSGSSTPVYLSIEGNNILTHTGTGGSGGVIDFSVSEIKSTGGNTTLGNLTDYFKSLFLSGIKFDGDLSAKLEYTYSPITFTPNSLEVPTIQYVESIVSASSNTFTSKTEVNTSTNNLQTQINSLATSTASFSVSLDGDLFVADTSTGTGVSFVLGSTITVTEMKAYVLTAPTGSPVSVSLACANLNCVIGSSLTIPAGQLFSNMVSSPTTVAKDTRLSLRCQQKGSTVAGAQLMMYIKYWKNVGQ